ncbi:MAG: histidinol-phosphatase HisJ family protein [Clostridiales bacterium]|nr:histidinol-phosphatase HisJ family protein [Clostridiales bacterium]
MTKNVYKCDLHIHTNYSFDSVETMESYVLKALDIGLDAICFTDHIDINKHYNTFATFDFDGRLKEFEQIKKRYGDKLQLFLGFEMGEPHLHPKETAFLRTLKSDIIIGSIHHSLDYEPNANVTRRQSERIYDRYVRQMVEEGDFDVLGHIDMLKKYHSDYVGDFEHVCQTLEICVKRNIIPEINTSSLRSGAQEPMPSLVAIEHYKSAGGKYVAVNSDSHSVESLGDGVALLDKLPDGIEQWLPKHCNK